MKRSLSLDEKDEKKDETADTLHKKQKMQDSENQSSNDDRTPTAITPAKEHKMPTQDDKKDMTLITLAKEQATEQSTDEKAILAVLDSVQCHSSNVNVVKHSMAYLTSLIESDEANWMLLLDADDGLEVLASAMKRHMDDAELQDHGGDLISLLSERIETMPVVQQIDAIWAIIAVMKELQAFEVILEECCQALISFTYQDPANEEIVAMADGLDPILATMKIHLNSPDLLSSCCMVLMNMTCNNDDNKAKIAEEGGIETILTAMQAHPHCEFVQGEALGALENILDLEEYMEDFVDHNGILLTREAMRNHPGDAEVQNNGCGVFWKISECSNDEYIIPIVQAGGIALTVSAMAFNPDNQLLQLRACEFFCNLINQNEATKDVIIEAGGLEVIGSAIRIHRKIDDETLTTAQELMASLIQTKK